MNKRKAKKALREVAKKHGVSVEEVRREIELVIKTAMASSDPKIQENWGTIAPTPEDLIAHLAGVVEKKVEVEQPMGNPRQNTVDNV